MEAAAATERLHTRWEGPFACFEEAATASRPGPEQGLVVVVARGRHGPSLANR